MPTDKENVQFLYSIIKQLEVKHVGISPPSSYTPSSMEISGLTPGMQIKWDTIAETNAIAKPHTARMRFHRLRQTMEGTVSKPRRRKNDDGSSSKETSIHHQPCHLVRNRATIPTINPGWV